MATRIMKDKLLLIDTNSLIHRAYHALPPLKSPTGEPTGALYGLTSVLIKIFKNNPPKYAAAAFDRPEPTFRKQEYQEYKATRQPTPDDLKIQIRKARELLEKFGVKTFEKPGYEADDLIVTLAEKFSGKIGLVEILSGDLDLLQAVREGKVVAEIPKQGISETKTYDRAAVKERFGVYPEQLIDYKGLVGDSSDNFPGVKGIGPKTASDLIQKYGGIYKIYESIEEIEKEKATVANKLKENKENALLSRRLALLITNVPIETNLEELEVGDPFKRTQLIEHMESLGFKTLLNRIEPKIEEPPSNVGKLF